MDRKRFFECAVLLVLWGCIYPGTIAAPAFFDDADTVHAEAVREMVASGDWVTLRINNGIRYLEKAPFMYWLSALSVTLFGLSDWAVRLPVALFALFLTFLIYRFAERFWGRETGFYAALIYVTSLGPFAFTRIFLPDVMLAFFMALSFYFYLRVLIEPQLPERMLLGRFDPRCMAIYASVALAVLTKGLVGAIFVGLVILAHMALSGRWDMLRRLQILPGVALFLLIAAPWHLAAGFSNKNFFWFYFMNEHFLRYLGLRYPKDYDTVPLWLFWTLHLAWLFPWTAFLPGFGRLFPKRLRPESAGEQVTLFLFLWIFLILGFFSFSTTQEYYTFPTLPAFCLLLGQVMARLDPLSSARDQRTATAGMAILAGLGTLVGVGLFLLARIGSGAVGATNDLSATLTVNPEQYALSFGHMHDLTPATFAHLSGLVYRTGAIFLACPLLALALAIRRKWLSASLFLALMMVGLLHSYHSGMVAFEPVLSSRGLAHAIEQAYRPGDRIVINGVYERGSSINYYTHLQVSVLNGHFGNLWFGSYYPDAPPVFLDDDSFVRLWSSGERIFFFSEKLPLESFLSRHPGFAGKSLAEEGGKKVLVNW